jgi:hypothetical protein
MVRAVLRLPRPASVLAAALSAAVILSTPQAHAAGVSGKRASLGVILGFAIPTGASAAVVYGAQATYRLLERINLGVFFTRYSVGLRTSGGGGTASIDASTATTSWGGQALYQIDTDIAGGLKAGLLKTSPDVNAAGTTGSVSFTDGNTGFFFAPTLAYDHMMGRYSLGADLSYTYSLSSSVPKSLNLCATAKLWF